MMVHLMVLVIMKNPLIIMTAVMEVHQATHQVEVHHLVIHLVEVHHLIIIPLGVNHLVTHLVEDHPVTQVEMITMKTTLSKVMNLSLEASESDC